MDFYDEDYGEDIEDDDELFSDDEDSGNGADDSGNGDSWWCNSYINKQTFIKKLSKIMKTQLTCGLFWLARILSRLNNELRYSARARRMTWDAQELIVKDIMATALYSQRYSLMGGCDMKILNHCKKKCRAINLLNFVLISSLLNYVLLI